jgi:hypothetical protein
LSLLREYINSHIMLHLATLQHDGRVIKRWGTPIITAVTLAWQKNCHGKLHRGSYKPSTLFSMRYIAIHRTLSYVPKQHNDWNISVC